MNLLDEAIAAFDEAIRLNPKEPDVWYNKGIVLHKREKFEEAIKVYDESIKLNPSAAQVWNNKGVALHNLGKYEEAIKAYEEAIKLNPGYTKDETASWRSSVWSR